MIEQNNLYVKKSAPKVIIFYHLSSQSFSGFFALKHKKLKKAAVIFLIW
jgi:hypothetical protein